MEKEALEQVILNTEYSNHPLQKGVIKCRVDLNNIIFDRYLEVKNELKNREASFFGISQYLNELLEKVPKDIDSQIIEKHTPLEFKIKNLLQKEGAREKLEKLISKL